MSGPDDDDPVILPRPRLAFRVNGARVGTAARPTASAPPRLATRRFGLRVNASALGTARPTTDDDGEAAS